MSNLLNWWRLFSARNRLRCLDIPPKWFMIAQKYDLSNDIPIHISYASLLPVWSFSMSTGVKTYCL